MEPPLGTERSSVYWSDDSGATAAREDRYKRMVPAGVRVQGLAMSHLHISLHDCCILTDHLIFSWIKKIRMLTGVETVYSRS